MTEDQLEQETLGWLSELGYAVHSGYNIVHDGPNPQRASYREVVLADRLREAIQRLNPKVPTAAREDALHRLLDLGIAHELTENLKKNISVDWAQRESVRATLRLMVKRVLRKYKYPPDQAEEAVELVLQQVETLGEAWV